MSNIMRWQYGEINAVTLPVKLETDIEIGDQVLKYGENAEPASSITDSGEPEYDFTSAQKQFHDSFVGVAMQRSRVGDTQPIRIATSGVFEFDCDEATFELGDRVGVADAGTQLEDQKVVKIPHGAFLRSIGRVANRVASADTKVLVEINSTIMRDGQEESSDESSEQVSQTEEAAERIADVAVSSSNASLAGVLKRIEQLEKQSSTAFTVSDDRITELRRKINNHDSRLESIENSVRSIGDACSE